MEVKGDILGRTESKDGSWNFKDRREHLVDVRSSHVVGDERIRRVAEMEAKEVAMGKMRPELARAL